MDYYVTLIGRAQMNSVPEIVVPKQRRAEVFKLEHSALNGGNFP